MAHSFGKYYVNQEELDGKLVHFALPCHLGHISGIGRFHISRLENAKLQVEIEAHLDPQEISERTIRIPLSDSAIQAIQRNNTSATEYICFL